MVGVADGSGRMRTDQNPANQVAEQRGLTKALRDHSSKQSGADRQDKISKEGKLRHHASPSIRTVRPLSSQSKEFTPIISFSSVSGILYSSLCFLTKLFLRRRIGGRGLTPR